MKKYEFNLVKAYSIYSNAVVLNQNGSQICFLLSYYESKNLKKNLRTAFINYLNYVRLQKDCPENFKKKPAVRFVYGNGRELREKIKEKGENKNYGG